MKKLIAIVGSNAENSTNRDLLNYMKRHFADEADIELVEIKDFPMFDKPASKEVPEMVKEIANKIEASDGVIISTSEYNHSIPSTLRNALHWLSYYIYPLVDKPVMITGASYGCLGSSRAHVHLRQILDSRDIKARVMPNNEFMLGYSLQAFDENGDLKDEETIAHLDDIFREFLIFMEVTDLFIQKFGSQEDDVKNVKWEASEKEEA